ncbi:hypothetical protein [Streptomyces sp. NPDC050504]|uniref:hypothetical protein n=1 Tax=Streptomyces sp. NPDC050504 TaxID=3365618 RepID=UPI0037910E40
MPFGSASADDPAPGSGQGGKPGPSAPPGLKVTTELPQRIEVDNKTGKTTLNAKVRNGGTKASGPVTLSVVGFDGLRIDAVDGCVRIPGARLPKGSNSGFACVLDNLAAGKDRSYAVSATYDLKKTGKICLPVTVGTTEQLIWQQGPVAFGTTSPTPNAPDTPLLLGTENVPFGPDRSAKPAPPKPGALPSTGAPDGTLPLALAAAGLLVLGAAGVWWTSRPRKDR